MVHAIQPQTHHVLQGTQEKLVVQFYFSYNTNKGLRSLVTHNVNASKAN